MWKVMKSSIARIYAPTSIASDFKWKTLIDNFFSPIKEKISWESQNICLHEGVLSQKRTHIPINKRTVFRELLQDVDVVSPSERDNFEKVAIALDSQLKTTFRLLQQETSVLSQAIQPISATSDTSVRQLNVIERSDQQFWLLRRFSELATAAGFVEVTQGQVKRSQNTRISPFRRTETYVEPSDYSVIRIWICRVFPCSEKQLASAFSSSRPQVRSSDKTHSGFWRTVISRIVPTRLQLFLTKISDFRRQFGDTRDRSSRRVERFCLDKVLMAVQTKNESSLHLRLFQNVPCPKPDRTCTQNLKYLLPLLRSSPPGTLDRLIVFATSAVALGSLGLIAPSAYVFASNPSLVFAWCVATSAGAGAAASLVWLRYWRTQTAHAEWVKQLYYECGLNADAETLNSLLKLAFEEAFKSTLLTYALLLRPSEIESPISPGQLEVRAASWISKRLPTKNPITLWSSLQESAAYGSHEFADKLDPIFNIFFSPDRALNVLRRLNLVHGPADSPRARPINEAAAILQNDQQINTSGLYRLWFVDPLVDEESALNESNESL
ncbi:hypothetical protein D915_000377 [Fasciola hepatica]|uniref:Transmembrane protein n=1 Tax=Fasciola hepatica TaxID=6192 RepID=A0A4E0RIR2_FASHE|nr:hypothetical protein D915_000377 [Fasciola hepatica]